MNTGHGHVYPREDGLRMRCGGPAMCAKCALDQARKLREDELATFHSSDVVIEPATALPMESSMPLTEVWDAFLSASCVSPTASWEQRLSATADRCQCSVQHVLAAIAMGNADIMLRLQPLLTKLARG